MKKIMFFDLIVGTVFLGLYCLLLTNIETPIEMLKGKSDFWISTIVFFIAITFFVWICIIKIHEAKINAVRSEEQSIADLKLKEQKIEFGTELRDAIILADEKGFSRGIHLEMEDQKKALANCVDFTKVPVQGEIVFRTGMLIKLEDGRVTGYEQVPVGELEKIDGIEI